MNVDGVFFCRTPSPVAQRRFVEDTIGEFVVEDALQRVKSARLSSYHHHPVGGPKYTLINVALLHTVIFYQISVPRRTRFCYSFTTMSILLLHGSRLAVSCKLRCLVMPPRAPAVRINDTTATRFAP